MNIEETFFNSVAENEEEIEAIKAKASQTALDSGNDGGAVQEAKAEEDKHEV